MAGILDWLLGDQQPQQAFAPPNPPQQTPTTQMNTGGGILHKMGNALLGMGDPYGMMDANSLSPEQRQQMIGQTLLQLGTGIASSNARNPLAAVGQGFQYAQQQGQQAGESRMRGELFRQQIDERRRKAAAAQKMKDAIASGDSQAILAAQAEANPESAGSYFLGRQDKAADRADERSWQEKMENDRRRWEAANRQAPSPIQMDMGDRVELRDRAGNLIGSYEKGRKPEDSFGNANKLRDEFLAQTKPFVEAQTGFEKVKAAANNPSAAGDVSLIFGYMKTIDPGSTVREGEFANVENAGGVPQQIMNTYNRIVSGQRLTPEQRADFLNQAQLAFGVYENQYKQTQAYYKQMAQRYGLNPDDILVPRDAPMPEKKNPPAAPNPADVEAELRRRGVLK